MSHRPTRCTPLAIAIGLSLVGHATAASAGQTCTSGPFVMGVDVYHGDGTIDWAQVAGAGVKFAIIKASQGTYDTDGNFAANWSGAKAAGLVRAPYHFLDPTQSGAAQATYFLGVVGALTAEDLPPVLDIECPTSNDEPDSDNCLGTGSSGDATGAAITTVMNDWLTAVKAATGKTPVVYSYNSYFSDDGVDTTGLASFPLYIADPTTNGCFDFPAPWGAATFWQYSDTGTVAGIGSGSVDLDYFLGTAADLTAFAANGAAPSDAGASDDAGVDAGATCVVTSTGESGDCIDTSACAARGGTSTPDFCPGPANIQCCTGGDAGSANDGGGGGHGGGHDSGAPGLPDAGADATVIHIDPGGALSPDASPASSRRNDATADDASDEAGAPGASGGCSITRGGASSGAGSWLPLLGLAAVLRRGRRRRLRGVTSRC
jgi:lysozyme